MGAITPAPGGSSYDPASVAITGGTIGGDSITRTASQYAGAGLEFVLTNTASAANVLALKSTGTGGYSAMAFRTSDGVETSAFGTEGDPAASSAFASTYAESSAVSGTARPLRWINTVAGNSVVVLEGLRDQLFTTLDVGIGAGAPAAKLHIKSGGEQLRVGFNDANYMSVTVDSAANVALGAGSYTFTGAIRGFTVKNPSASDYPGIAFQNEGGSTRLFFGHANGSTGGAVAGLNFADCADDFCFQNGATTLMRIKTNGRINMPALPTSSAGLSAGDIWSNLGILTIV